MKKVIIIIGAFGFFIISIFIFNTDIEFILFFVLVIALFLLYSIYKESIRRENKISELKEEIETLKK